MRNHPIDLNDLAGPPPKVPPNMLYDARLKRAKTAIPMAISLLSGGHPFNSKIDAKAWAIHILEGLCPPIAQDLFGDVQSLIPLPKNKQIQEMERLINSLPKRIAVAQKEI